MHNVPPIANWIRHFPLPLPLKYSEFLVKKKKGSAGKSKLSLLKFVSTTRVYTGPKNLSGKNRTEISNFRTETKKSHTFWCVENGKKRGFSIHFANGGYVSPLTTTTSILDIPIVLACSRTWVRCPHNAQKRFCKKMRATYCVRLSNTFFFTCIYTKRCVGEGEEWRESESHPLIGTCEYAYALLCVNFHITKTKFLVIEARTRTYVPVDVCARYFVQFCICLSEGKTSRTPNPVNLTLAASYMNSKIKQANPNGKTLYTIG